MRADIILRLPRPIALILTSTLFHLTTAARGLARSLDHLARASQTPQPTPTLDVVEWPLKEPTTTPPPRIAFGNARFRRLQDIAHNTVCGYLGGDPAFPATCSFGSHCVLDLNHHVVGCCPDGEDICTAGVFTGCVDDNSGPQTEIDPYIYTCQGGGNMCYKNVFDGGFSQFGCGTASNLATSVFASATGITNKLVIPTISISFTHSRSALGVVTSLGAKPTTSLSILSISTTSHSSTSMTAAQSSTTTFSISSTSTASQTPSKNSDSNSTHVGAIVGGTLGAAAALIVIVALIFWYRRRNSQQPDAPKGMFSPVVQEAERPSHLPVPPGYHGDRYGTHYSYPPPQGYEYNGPPGTEDFAARSLRATAQAEARAAELRMTRGLDSAESSYSRKTTNVQPSFFHSEDETPLSREIEDFSRAFRDALGRIREEEVSEDVLNGTGLRGGGNRKSWYYSVGMKSLWQPKRPVRNSESWL